MIDPETLFLVGRHLSRSRSSIKVKVIELIPWSRYSVQRISVKHTVNLSGKVILLCFIRENTVNRHHGKPISPAGVFIGGHVLKLRISSDLAAYS